MRTRSNHKRVADRLIRGGAAALAGLYGIPSFGHILRGKEGRPKGLQAERSVDDAKLDQLEIIRLLLRDGADPNHPSGGILSHLRPRPGVAPFVTTPLIEASTNGSPGAVSLLCAGGGNPLVVSGGRNALDACVDEACLNILRSFASLASLE